MVDILNAERINRNVVKQKKEPLKLYRVFYPCLNLVCVDTKESSFVVSATNDYWAKRLIEDRFGIEPTRIEEV